MTTSLHFPVDDFCFPESAVPHNNFSPRAIYMMALMSTYAKSHKSANILEAGSWCGYSALTWAQGIKEFFGGDGMLTCVDIWAPYMNDHDLTKHRDCQMSNETSSSGAAHQIFLHNMKVGQKKYGVKINSICGQTEDTLPLLQEDTFDIVYLDADHSYKFMKRDLPLCARLVREGGYLCGDDLEAQIHELSPEGIELARKIDTNSVIRDPVNGSYFHPGVTLAISEYFGSVSAGAGFWAMQKRDGKFCSVNLVLENSFKPLHLHEKDQSGGYDQHMKDHRDGKQPWAA